MATRGRLDVAIYVNNSLKTHGMANALQYLRVNIIKIKVLT